MALSPLAQSLVRESYRSWNDGSRQPTIVTYSFATSSEGWPRTQGHGALPFGAPQMASVRLALDAWASVSGVRFIEVADVPRAGIVDMRIRLADLAGASHETSSPSDGGEWSIDSRYAADAMGPGTEGYEIMLRAIGHALGLNNADAGLSPQTAMALYVRNAPNLAGLRAADVEAIQHVYGTQQAEDAFHTRWSWDTGRQGILHLGNDMSQTMPGTALRDIIMGYGGNDIIDAGVGDDLINAGSGGNTVAGGPGLDTLQTDGFRAQTALNALRHGTETNSTGSHISLSGRLVRPGEDTLFSGIETIAFADGRLVFNAADPVAQVVRLYQAALGRQPDTVGKEYWVAKLQAGAPLADLARSFLDSPEFLDRFGRPDDAGFVATAYRQALGREADAGGASYWQAKLAGGMSRADMLTGFSESPENHALTAPLLANGIWDADDQMADIARLYKAVLGRIPEAEGLRYWDNQADNGASESQMANLFAASPEFNSRFPGASDDEFVVMVYQNTLGRGPDPDGQGFWLNHLANGLTRGEMVAGVTHSNEFLILSTALTEGGIVFV